MTGRLILCGRGREDYAKQEWKEYKQGSWQMTKADTPIVILRFWRGMAGCS